jgi:YgiT-type zinc finger domain-containing protein
MTGATRVKLSPQESLRGCGDLIGRENSAEARERLQRVEAIGFDDGLPEANTMKCIVCTQAETNPGMPTVTLERRDATFVFKDVPAQICPNCGEDYLDDVVSGSLLKSADAMVAAGTQIDIRRYPATV